MKLVLSLALLLVPSLSAASDLDPAVLLELAKAKRLREARPSTPVITKTTCGCAATGKCLCWKGECQCAACGLGGAAKQVGKSQASTTTPTTPVPLAEQPRQQATERGSSAVTPQADTSMNAQTAIPAGFTSGCASGQCASPAQSRFRFRR